MNSRIEIASCFKVNGRLRKQECTTDIRVRNIRYVLVNEMPKSARYHIDRANSKVFTSKRLPLQSVSSKRNHQVTYKFRKMSSLNVYGRKRGRVGVKQCMHSFHSLDCLLSVFFDDYMSLLKIMKYCTKV